MQEVRDQYVHLKTGNLYTLLYVANEQATRPDWVVTAVYQDEDGVVWSRPISEFDTRYRKSIEGKKS